MFSSYVCAMISSERRLVYAGIERSRLRTGEGLLAVSKNPVVPKRIHGDPNSRALTGNEIVL